MTPTKQAPKAPEKEKVLTDSIDNQEDDDFYDEQENEDNTEDLAPKQDPKISDKTQKKPKTDIDLSLIHFKNERNATLSFI